MKWIMLIEHFVTYHCNSFTSIKSLHMQQPFLKDEETEFKLFAHGHVVNKLISYVTMAVLPLTSATWWWWWLS